jgi:hypothetical protein
MGINYYYCTNSIIRNNIVHNLCGSATDSYEMGIVASGDVGQRGANVWIYNNMVYDINNRAQSSGEVVGIYTWYQDSVRVEYNSVYLTETGDVAPTGGTSAVRFDSTNTLPSLRNNILVNTRNDSPYMSAAIRLFTTAKISDYNDLYVGPFSKRIFRRGAFSDIQIPGQLAERGA